MIWGKFLLNLLPHSIIIILKTILNFFAQMFLYKNYYKHLELDKAEIETKLISIYNYLAKYSDYMDVNSSKNRKDELDRLILKEITDIDFYFEYESYRENYYY